MTMQQKARVAKELSRQSRNILLGLFGAFAIILLCLGFAGFEKGMRWAGMLLELIGIALVVCGLFGLFPHFEMRPALSSVADWFREWRYVFVERPPITGRGNAQFAEGADSSRAYGYGAIRLDGTEQEKFQRLEDYVNHLADNIGRMHARIDAVEKSAINITRQEEAERKQQITETRELIKRSFMDHIQLEFVGALYLLLGVFTSSFPGL